MSYETEDRLPAVAGRPKTLKTKAGKLKNPIAAVKVSFVVMRPPLTTDYCLLTTIFNFSLILATRA
jgi:hypothetical protein